MNKDLYEILGVSRNATEDEIKKAFRKLSLQYHPDRQGGKSEEEKKAAEEKFKEIGAAYAILSDPDKKAQYDRFGTVDENMMNGTGFNFDDIFGHMEDIFGGMFGGSRRTYKKQTPQNHPGMSVKMQVGVSIKDILNGKIDKEVKYDCKVRCHTCNGIGGDGISDCPHCHGTGMITETQYGPFGMIQNSHPCQYCGASGKVIKNKCKSCNGTGFEIKEKSIHVFANYPRNGQEILFKGMGYESKTPGMPAGDLIVVLSYDFDRSKYIIKPDEGGCMTIYEKVDVPYYDAILGTSKLKGTDFKHKLENGKEVSVNIPKYCQEGQQIDIGGSYSGLKYKLVVHIKMPTYIRDSEKELLEKIKKENSK